MKLKAKNHNENIIEKFSAQSSKTAKFAKQVVKKREASELKSTAGASSNIHSATLGNSTAGDAASVSQSAAGNTVNSQVDQNTTVSEKSGTAGSHVQN